MGVWPNAGTAKQTAKAAIMKDLMVISFILGMRLFGSSGRLLVSWAIIFWLCVSEFSQEYGLNILDHIFHLRISHALCIYRTFFDVWFAGGG